MQGVLGTHGSLILFTSRTAERIWRRVQLVQPSTRATVSVKYRLIMMIVHIYKRSTECPSTRDGAQTNL